MQHNKLTLGSYHVRQDTRLKRHINQESVSLLDLDGISGERGRQRVR